MIGRHLNKISRPLLDRIDLCVEVRRPPLWDLVQKEPEESSAQIRARVELAQEIQRKRFAQDGIRYNSQIPATVGWMDRRNACCRILLNGWS